MRLFVQQEELADWEGALAPLAGAARLEVLLQLGWHLRQRDAPRAQLLLAELTALLPSCRLAPAVAARLQGRMGLIHGEILWLQANLVDAQACARASLRIFTELEDDSGCADAHWLLAWIAVDAGRLADNDRELELAIQAARRANDVIRVTVAEAALARWAVLRNPVIALERWGQHFLDPALDAHPGLATWVNDFRAVLTHHTTDFGHAVTHSMQANAAALASGQVRMAIITATNVAEGFNRLNDHHAALEWMQRALELARPTGWPRNVGACLMHMGDTMRYLGNLDAAQTFLDEALVTLLPLEGARVFSIALQYQGDLALARREFPRALSAFRTLEQKAALLQQMDFRIDAQRGQAAALLEIGDANAALRAGELALQLARAQGDASRTIETLLVLAEIHRSLEGAAVAAPTHTDVVSNEALACLLQAHATASTISDYTVPATLFEALGREYARSKDYARGYEMAMLAIAAREKTHGQQVTNRATAMQVFHQTERAKAEGDYHRELAASEIKRAEILQQTGAMLEHLSAIGQEITTHLHAAAIFQILNRHVHALLDVTSFAIYLMQSDGKKLIMSFGVEAGNALPVVLVALDDPNANSARCVRERCEILRDLGGDAGHSYVPGTLNSLSALYAPLTVGDRVLGVMTIQTLVRHAYGDRERMVFRTLCAYAAIALDNAQTYQQLQSTQQQLIAQETMAALGSLVAGVAHELNTPIGNSILFASTLKDKTSALHAQFQQQGLRRSDLAGFLEESDQAAELILRGLQSAADLVSSFKQVAVDRTTTQRRVFKLKQFGHEILATMVNQIRNAGHTAELDIDEELEMDSYPGPLGQVITNLINNAILHGLENRSGGTILFSAVASGDGRVQIRFSDDGVGISAEHQQKIFNPFFTTKLGHGGSGLGLSISYNIVTSLLNGQITVHSAPDAGTTFLLDLPLVTAN